MDIDKVEDLNVLRLALKKERAQIKQEVTDEDTGFTFKVGHWYKIDVHEDGVMIYSDDLESSY
jgi:hypothetical protein